MEAFQYVALGLFAVLFITICGYELYQSQKEAFHLDNPLCKLVVVLECNNGNRRVDTIQITDQDHAQQVLNEYMFHMIKQARVFDPVTGTIVAKMDKNGRLLGV